MTKKKLHLYLIKLIPIFFVIVNFLFKIIGIRKEAIAGDEPFTIFVAHRDFSDIITYLSNYNNPPLYELLLHFWMKMFGNGEMAVRFLPLIFSSVAVYFVYKIAHLLRNRKAAFLASVLFTFSTFLYTFAQESRVYSLFMLLALASCYLFILILKYNKTKSKIAFVIVTTLILYAHYFGFFVLFVQGFMLLMNPEFRKKFWKFLLLYLAVFLLYSPQIFVVITRFSSSASNGTWVPPVESMDSLRMIFFVISNYIPICYFTFILLIIGLIYFHLNNSMVGWAKKITLTFTLIFAIGFLFSFGTEIDLIKQFELDKKGKLVFVVIATSAFMLVQWKSKLSNYYKFILAWVFIPPFLMFTLSIKLPIFVERYLIYFIPAFYILITLSIYRLPKKFQAPLAVFVSIVFIFSFKINNRHADLRNLASKVKELKTKETQVIMCPEYFDVSLMYYYDRSIYSQKGFQADGAVFPKYKETLRKNGFFSVVGQYDSNLPKLDSNKRLIYIDALSEFFYKNNGILESLKNFYHIKDSVPCYEFYNGYKVYVFEKTSK
ncbi:MAG: glycosyltransferase family 39 protein [Fluviicola sp.]|jgi:4-amino-4-deoxy-L-arabinose transferase-like glycosyltransferase